MRSKCFSLALLLVAALALQSCGGAGTNNLPAKMVGTWTTAPAGPHPTTITISTIGLVSGGAPGVSSFTGLVHANGDFVGQQTFLGVFPNFSVDITGTMTYLDGTGELHWQYAGATPGLTLTGDMTLTKF